MRILISGRPAYEAVVDPENVAKIKAVCGNLNEPQCLAKMTYLNMTYGTGNPFRTIHELVCVLPDKIGGGAYHLFMRHGHDFLHTWIETWASQHGRWGWL